jgi:GT2 family glycosyltransferase
MNLLSERGASAEPLFGVLRVQSVLFRTELPRIERSLGYLNAAAGYVKASGLIESVEIAYGDCSPTPAIDSQKLEDLRKANTELACIGYTFFNANLGSAAGHNRLLEAARSELTVILNPDVLMFPNAIAELLAALVRPGVGLVEARQVPIEHAKDYDVSTGETSWASTACAMGRTELFQELNGFDSESFFLYCDDVDFSWRVRLAGYKVVHQSSAMVFHDKRLNQQGGWIASEAEKYYSAEAAMILAYKYSRKDLTREYLSRFKASESETYLKAADALDQRLKTGRMPKPIDQTHRVAQFINGAYAIHRFPAR